MKRLGVLTVLAVLALGGVADAHLEQATARYTAEGTAYEFQAHKTWATASKVGACRRQSANRIRCDARVTGDEYAGCEFEEPFSCAYVFHRCEFKIEVHAAGYSSIGRVQVPKCTARRHSG